MGNSNRSSPEQTFTRDMSVPFKDVYVMGEELGKGAFAPVKKATHKGSKTTCAVKLYQKDKLKPDDAEKLKREIVILQSLDHPNIIKLLDIFSEKVWIYLVMEYVPGGELFDRIVQKKSYNESEARDISRVMCQAMEYCHENHVCHRDLKPDNILLVSRQNDTNIKIVDFGFAKKAIKSNSLSTQCGTPAYIAPEIIYGVPYGTEVDMWSLGVVMYILLSGYPPFHASNHKDLFELIKRGMYKFHDDHWSKISNEAKDLVSDMLQVDPKKRVTAHKALYSKWMKQDAEILRVQDLSNNLVKLRKFNAKRKFRQAVLAHIAMEKMTHFIGLGKDLTFGFNKKSNPIPGCDVQVDKIKRTLSADSNNVVGVGCCTR